MGEYQACMWEYQACMGSTKHASRIGHNIGSHTPISIQQAMPLSRVPHAARVGWHGAGNRTPKNGSNIKVARTDEANPRVLVDAELDVLKPQFGHNNAESTPISTNHRAVRRRLRDTARWRKRAKKRGPKSMYGVPSMYGEYQNRRHCTVNSSGIPGYPNPIPTSRMPQPPPTGPEDMDRA